MESTLPAGHGLSLSQVVARLGGLAEVVPGDDGEPLDPVVEDVTLAEPGEGVGVAGDIVLGLGVSTADAARAMVGSAAARGIEVVALRRSLTRDASGLAQSAREQGVTVVAVADDASWAHLAWLLREILDRAATHPSTDRAPGDDLLALADACTAILGAPVTIEDTRSRVVAYSELHDGVDPVRVSTILGRRAPAATVASLRSRGVFRHLARSTDPLFVPAAPDSPLGARHIIPARVGDEWVGSIWAVVDAPLPPDRLARARDLVRLVSLHLLRLRTEAEVGRRLVEERVRAAIGGEATAATNLPAAPWRAVVLGVDPDGTLESGLTLWESVLRRSSWRQPLIAGVEGDVVAVVAHPGPGTPVEPGSWPWLSRAVSDVATRQPWAIAAAGDPTSEVAGLAASLATARELAALMSAGTLPGPVTTSEEGWAELTVSRAVAAGATPSSTDAIAGLEPTLIATLRVWLDHPAHPRACAEALHVHPNTVRYRIARVREALGVDLDDPTVRLALALLTRVDRSR